MAADNRHGTALGRGPQPPGPGRLARRLLDELRQDRAARAVTEPWTPYVADLRTRVHTLADEASAAAGPGHRLAERLDLEVRAGEAVSLLSRAVAAARSVRGPVRGDTAQLPGRSALFVLVRGQTAKTRAARLARAAAVPDLIAATPLTDSPTIGHEA